MTENRSGILLLDKPAGITSADALNQLKRKHRFARIGHGGTLDPFATGLMVVLLGEATKVARFLLEGEKQYEAEAALGLETDSGDLTGTVVNTLPAPSLSTEEWQKFADKFLGRTRQTPPVYSAIKVKGKALYEYARKGEEVEIKDREVTIRELQILAADKGALKFKVSCSGGTYIRVLAADIAKAAGSTAHLRALRRTGSSAFRVADAITLEKALETPAADIPLRSLTEGLAHLPKVNCGPDQAQKVRQGNLAVFDSLRGQMEKPGYFLLLEGGKAVAICNHNPMLIPFCSIERVFDPRHV
jgi:tRNA pseudouridine55 synthase